MARDTRRRRSGTRAGGRIIRLVGHDRPSCRPHPEERQDHYGRCRLQHCPGDRNCRGAHRRSRPGCGDGGAYRALDAGHRSQGQARHSGTDRRPRAHGSRGPEAVYPSLGRVRSIRDIQDRIAELARGKKPGEWIVTMPIGDPPYYFDVPGILAEKRWPTRQELDAAAPNNPVYIRSIWGFWRQSPPLVSCANTEALKRAAITRDTVSPVKSLVIEKDANGDPTGVFVEDGMQPTAELLWFRKATAFSRADRARTLPLAARAYHAFGTTGIY